MNDYERIMSAFNDGAKYIVKRNNAVYLVDDKGKVISHVSMRTFANVREHLRVVKKTRNGEYYEVAV